MKFNEKYLSIPPYISTAWNNVKSLHMSGNQLVVTLADGSHVHIPDLDLEEIENLFEVHTKVLENTIGSVVESQDDNKLLKTIDNDLFGKNIAGGKSGASFKIGLGGIEGMDSLGFAMQHNPELANSPNLPNELLLKIGTIVKIISPEEAIEIPPPEPHCNCPHCQIARAISTSLGNTVRPYAGHNDLIDEDNGSAVQEEEIVSDEDLHFDQWEIQQSGHQLFTVVNKLNVDEKYNVFLGSPVGCTCGEEGCAHVLAVLHS